MEVDQPADRGSSRTDDDSSKSAWSTPRQLIERQVKGIPACTRYNHLLSQYSLGFSHHEIRRLGYACPTNRVMHDGCVNTAAWSEDGRVLLTGSDDRCVKLWSTSDNYELKAEIRTGHMNNIFGVAAVPGSDLNEILSCSADGTLRVLRPSSARSESIVCSSSSIMHGFSFWWGEPGGSAGKVVFTAQDDGFICRYDLREPLSHGTAILTRQTPKGRCIPVKAIALSVPENQCRGISPWHLCVGGMGASLEVYDLRSLASVALEAAYSMDDNSPLLCEPVQCFRPRGLEADVEKTWMDGEVSVSGLVYSRSRPELLVSYQGDQIYAFSTESAALSEAAVEREAYSLGGHINSQTFLKSVSYFGPHEEYIVSGSDSGHTWVWDRRTRKVINLILTDDSISNGCVPHPWTPTLACYGIDSAVKVLEVGGLPVNKQTIEAALERNMAMVIRTHGRGHLVHNEENFKRIVREMRGSSDESQLPDYPLDMTPDQAGGALTTPETLYAALTSIKTLGNEQFKAGKLAHAIKRYQKVLRYIRWFNATVAATARAKYAGRNGHRRSKDSGNRANGNTPLSPPLPSSPVSSSSSGGLSSPSSSFDPLPPSTLFASTPTNTSPPPPLPSQIHSCPPPPPDPSLTQQLEELQISCLLNLSACYLQESAYSQAMDMADAALDIRPDHAKALYRRGCAALLSGDARQAVNDLSRAQRGMPSDRAVAKKLVEARRALEHVKSNERRAFSAFFSEGGLGGRDAIMSS